MRTASNDTQVVRDACRCALVGGLTIAVIVGLSGCAGIDPVGSRVPSTKEKADLRAFNDLYDDPMSYALNEIREWDKATTVIQASNTGSIVGLAGLAGLVAYRTGRNHAGAATAVAAAGGLFGLSLSDALVVTSRLNIYNRGIGAMECAISAYKSVGGSLKQDARNNPETDADLSVVISTLEPDSPIAQGLREIASEIKADEAAVAARVDPPFIVSISRITQEVNEALFGTLVSAHDKLTSQSFPVPVKPATSPSASPAKAAAEDLLKLAATGDKGTVQTKLQEQARKTSKPAPSIDQSVFDLRLRKAKLAMDSAGEELDAQLRKAGQLHEEVDRLNREATTEINSDKFPKDEQERFQQENTNAALAVMRVKMEDQSLALQQATAKANAAVIDYDQLSRMRPDGGPVASAVDFKNADVITPVIIALQNLSARSIQASKAVQQSTPNDQYVQQLNTCSIVSFPSAPQQQPAPTITIGWGPSDSTKNGDTKALVISQIYKGTITGGTAPFVATTDPKDTSSLVSVTFDPANPSIIVVDPSKDKATVKTNVTVKITDAKGVTMTFTIAVPAKS